MRGSYGIEAPQAPAGQPGGIVEGNTIISERNVMGVSCPGKNTIVRNNKFYGPFAWGVVGGEPAKRSVSARSRRSLICTSRITRKRPKPPKNAPVSDGETPTTPDDDGTQIRHRRPSRGRHRSLIRSRISTSPI